LFTIHVNPESNICQETVAEIFRAAASNDLVQHFYDCARDVCCLPVDQSKSPKSSISVF